MLSQSEAIRRVHELAAARRDEALARVARNADTAAPGWTDRARDALARYVASVRVPFLIEDLRGWAYAGGLDEPHDQRAWGGVIRQAERDGVIERVGFAPAASSNLSPKTLWRAA